MSSWRAPPSRRELTLILFSLTVFILFYNLDTSFRLLGVDPASTQSALMGKLGFRKGIIGADGRRPPGWRDPLEGEIFGNWKWDEGHTAGNGEERQKLKLEKGGAIWLGHAHAAIGETQETLGEGTARDAYFHWGEQLPKARVVKHVPGYTIIDNLILGQGKVWLVTDDPDTLPPLGKIASSSKNSMKPPQDSEWQIVTNDQANTLGLYGSVVRGVTWLSTDGEHSNYTLLSLWRTYASLDHSIDSEGHTKLPAPRRLLFPNIPYVSESHPDRRSKSGVDELAAKAALPSLSLMYREDWEDFSLMHVSFVFERVVVVDRGAAARASGSQPVFSPPFEGLQASKYWFEPVRKAMTGFLQISEESGKKGKSTAVVDTKPVVTYLSTQEKTVGPRIKEIHNQMLLKGLDSLDGIELNVVPADARWDERMRILARSTIVLSVYGTNLADSYFMKPSPHTTIMEFFKTGFFSRDRELPARSLGMRYIAWWKDRKFVGDDLPAVVQPTEGRAEEIPIDAAAVVKAIQEAIEAGNAPDPSDSPTTVPT